MHIMALTIMGDVSLAGSAKLRPPWVAFYNHMSEMFYRRFVMEWGQIQANCEASKGLLPAGVSGPPPTIAFIR